MYDKNTKFLIVDDMKTMRKIVQKTLVELGYSQFVDAEDGAKAWEILTQPDHGVQFIVSDWNMPNCSGLDLLKRVRASSQHKSLPFILVTAESEASQVQSALQAGVDNYIVKPFAADAIMAKIEAVYKKRSAA